MTMKKDVIVSFLAVFFLTATLSTIRATSTTTRSTGPTYDPWADVSGPTTGYPDGIIDMMDLGYEASHYLASGTPMDRANMLSLAYDSGWIDITDKAGQYFDVTHNLGTTDVMVDITGKTTLDGGVHQKYFGGTDFVAGWNKTYGGANDDLAYFHSLVVTKDGGYALGCIIGGQPWLIKTDARGNIQWNRTYGGVGDAFDYGASLVQTSDGGYAILSDRKASGAGSYDFWLVRTDAFGTQLWNQSYGSGVYDYSASIIQTTEGGFALVGESFSGIPSPFYGYLVVTDSVGNMLWSKTYGSSGEGFSDIVQTSDGFAMAGITYAYAVGDRDMWLVKTNASGDMQWYKTYGTGGGETCYALIQTFDGGYALAGDTHGVFWLVKTDSLGNTLWDKTYGGGFPSDLVQTSDGGYALAGFTSSFGAGSNDFWLVKTDASGNIQWNKTYGGTNDDWAYALVQTGDGGFALTGAAKSFGAGDRDVWLVKTDAAGNALDGFKYGLAWVDSTANTIELCRGTDDECWNFVRVQVWTHM